MATETDKLLKGMARNVGRIADALEAIAKNTAPVVVNNVVDKPVEPKRDFIGCPPQT